LKEIGLDNIRRDDRSVVTVGTFDGVHLGHQAIIRYLCSRAKAVEGSATVVSFDPHPREVVTGERMPLLTTLEERAALLEALGVDRFVVLPFTRDLSMLEAEDYVRTILVETIGLREIVIGYDHHFGRNRSGSRETLEQLSGKYGFTVDVIPEQVVADAAVSSTRIRNVLADEGDVCQATALLGRPYQLTGTVVRGDGRGRLIGYPTANLRVGDPRKAIPLPGVYVVRARFDAVDVGGMMNIGTRPTFDETSETHIEVHLFDIDRDLYGNDIAVSFIDRIRDEQRFADIDGLVEQLARDEARCRKLLQVSS
jgi:riboflavin kinase / FMN adenylyltransferase